MAISTPADLDLLRFDSRSAAASLKRVKSALAAGANSNATDQAGDSALILALRAEQPTVAIALIASGARVDARGACGSPAIVLAAKSKRAANALMALINAGARLEARDRWGRSALHWAASVGSLQSGEALLSAGADPSAQDNAGRTVFEWASAFGDMAKEEWSKLLTAHGKAAAEARELRLATRGTETILAPDKPAIRL
jgi:ankyrin repeat protein